MGARAGGYWANWFCYLGSSACEHAAELDRDTLGRLLGRSGELWLDVYPDDERDDEEDGAEAEARPAAAEHPLR